MSNEPQSVGRRSGRSGTLRSVRGNRAIAGTAIGAASLFMATVAIMLNSTTLFYMGTALVATLAACRFQAYLAVRSLRFERAAPASVSIGDLVTIEITAWSEKRLRRPLITVIDNLPARLAVRGLTLSLPIAPAFDIPITTQYQFVPLKRGRYKWSGVLAEGTDALGLVTMQKEYSTEIAEMTILPRLIPVNLELPSSLGFGISEATSGQSRGSGLEPRGVREYAYGDSLRHVHWRSSARSGHLLVKEFETGSNSSAAFILQRTRGSDAGFGGDTSLELMIGHVAYLADAFLRSGARVEFPGIETPSRTASQRERMEEILETLTDVRSDEKNSLGTELLDNTGGMAPGSTVFVMSAVQDETLPGAAATLQSQGVAVVCLLYDASRFDPKYKRQTVTDPAFIQKLSASGASVVIVPQTLYDEDFKK